METNHSSCSEGGGSTAASCTVADDGTAISADDGTASTADATTPDQALPHSLLGDGEASLGLGEVAADPERLAGVEDRLHLLAKILRKHGPDLGTALRRQEEMTAELGGLVSHEERRATAQHEVEDALRASEAKYTTIYQTLPDAAGISRISDGCYIDVNPAFCALLGAEREAVLGRTSRELNIWASDQERARMLETHPAQPDKLKHARGGIIDLEFIVQYLILAHSHEHASLTGNLGNIALLRMAGELGLIDGELAEAAGNAYREYRRLQHAKRLSSTPKAPIPRDGIECHIAAVKALWQAVFGG